MTSPNHAMPAPDADFLDRVRRATELLEALVADRGVGSPGTELEFAL